MKKSLNGATNFNNNKGGFVSRYKNRTLRFTGRWLLRFVQGADDITKHNRWKDYGHNEIEGVVLMDVLIVGSGGREHAIGWKIRQNSTVDNLYFAPGNAGTAKIGKNINFLATDIEALVDFARNNMKEDGITIVGPESALEAGIVDTFRKYGLPIFGPDRAEAHLETSKSFAKEFMRKYDIPTAAYWACENVADALQALEKFTYPVVVKADGLASGKGVFICDDKPQAVQAIDKIMSERIFGDSGSRILLEEYMEGPEVTLMCFTDGHAIVPMESAGDYKRINDGNVGLNTGGMGSISPAFYYTPGMADEIVQKTLKGIKAEGMDYRGVLYIGLMVTAHGIKVIEYNARFGDPETEAILLRLDTDLLEIIKAVVNQSLSDISVCWNKDVAVSVVIVSGGYPEGYKTGYPILEPSAEYDNNSVVFHAGTKVDNDGTALTDGGRVLVVSSLGKDMNAARETTYQTVGAISFNDMHYRKDIGLKPLSHINQEVQT